MNGGGEGVSETEKRLLRWAIEEVWRLKFQSAAMCFSGPEARKKGIHNALLETCRVSDPVLLEAAERVALEEGAFYPEIEHFFAARGATAHEGSSSDSV